MKHLPDAFEEWILNEIEITARTKEQMTFEANRQLLTGTLAAYKTCFDVYSRFRELLERDQPKGEA